MPKLRPVISVLRLSLGVLIVVLMIIWIVLGVQKLNEIQQMETETRLVTEQDRIRYYVKQQYDRWDRGMTIFYAILEEVIALLSILGVIFIKSNLLHTSMILLSIIWFIDHYPMAAYYYYASPVMIASHVIHFIVVCIGLVFAYFVKDGNPDEKYSKISDTTTKSA